jgi:DNA-directed RNA polymerase specialized sigma24 family protein
MSITSTRPQSAASVPVQVTAQASSDKMLVARIAGGDRLAMQTRFAGHRTAVHRWVLRFVENETVAEDLLSDVFLDVWRQANLFQGRSSVSTWLRWRSPASNRSQHAAAGRMRNWMGRLRALSQTRRTTRR